MVRRIVGRVVRDLREASAAIQAEDPNHPVSTAHGELPDQALIDELTDIDLWGMNVYRWDVSYTAALDFAKRSDKPMYFSEIGADSYMSTCGAGLRTRPNQRAQADATRPFGAPVLRLGPQRRCCHCSPSPTAGGKQGKPTSRMQAAVAPASSGVPYDSDANEEHWGLVDIHRTPKEAYHVVKSLFNRNNASSGMKEKHVPEDRV